MPQSATVARALRLVTVGTGTFLSLSDAQPGYWAQLGGTWLWHVGEAAAVDCEGTTRRELSDERGAERLAGVEDYTSKATCHC